MDPLAQTLQNQIAIMEALSQLLPSANEVQGSLERNLSLSKLAFNQALIDASNRVFEKYRPERAIA